MWVEKEYSVWKYGNVRNILTAAGHKLTNGVHSAETFPSSIANIDVYCKNCQQKVIHITHDILQSKLEYDDAVCN